MKKDVQIALRLPLETWQKLMAEAAEREVSLSAIVRKAIDYRIDQIEEEKK